jgi:hypothetical protein
MDSPGRDFRHAVAHDRDVPDGTGGDQYERMKDLDIETPGARGRGRAFRGTRASANTSGPDFIRALGPVKLRSKIPHRTKKTCFFCRTGLEKRTLPKVDPAV